jgi:hypothetical protein
MKWSKHGKLMPISFVNTLANQVMTLHGKSGQYQYARKGVKTTIEVGFKYMREKHGLLVFRKHK